MLTDDDLCIEDLLASIRHDESSLIAHLSIGREVISLAPITVALIQIYACVAFIHLLRGYLSHCTSLTFIRDAVLVEKVFDHGEIASLLFEIIKLSLESGPNGLVLNPLDLDDILRLH